MKPPIPSPTASADRRATVFSKLASFIHGRVGDFKKTDLRDSTLALKYSAAVCAEHGEVTALCRNNEWRCWCGDSVMSLAEARRFAEDRALLSVANDPCFRC